MKRWSLSCVVASLRVLAFCLPIMLAAPALADDSLSQINTKGVVVWDGSDGSHHQIYRWDPKSPTAVNISQNSDVNDFPQINDKGQVVWHNE
jgi:hypothetical protein